MGWVMALLYRMNPDDPPAQGSKLPSAHELAGFDRFELERTRLQSLVTRLGGPEGACAGSFSPDMDALSSWTSPTRIAAENQNPPAEDPAPPVEDQAEDDGHHSAQDEGTEQGRGQAPTPTPDLPTVIRNLNVSMLKQLSGCGLAVEVGYRIGRSLRDSVVPASVASDVPVDGLAENDTPELKDKLRPTLAAFEAERISTIQRWLTTSAASFPKDAAQLVSVSLGRWAAFVAATLSTESPGEVRKKKEARSNAPLLSKGELADSVVEYLLPQGDVWLNLLAGSESTQGLVTPEGYVAAAEASLRRTGRIIRSVLWHYWVVVLAVAGAMGLVLALTFGTDWLGGPGKVWTTIAATAAALGVSWKGIASAVPKLAEKGESPIFALEEMDAMAWALTTFPPTQITAAGVRELRRAGVEKTAAVGRI
jgi:hypothetical protein